VKLKIIEFSQHGMCIFYVLNHQSADSISMLLSSYCIVLCNVFTPTRNALDLSNAIVVQHENNNMWF